MPQSPRVFVVGRNALTFFLNERVRVRIDINLGDPGGEEAHHGDEADEQPRAETFENDPEAIDSAEAFHGKYESSGISHSQICQHIIDNSRRLY